MSVEKTNILGLNREEISDFCASLGEKPFRGRQLYTWLYKKLQPDFAQMTDLAKDFREVLARKAKVELPVVEKSETSSDSSARKYRLKLSDGAGIEMALLKESGRVTLCVSSQVGCALGCRFCATGSMDFKRNLTTGEIIGQYITAARDSGDEITNIVFMGMGEPLLNYGSTAKAIRLFTDADGLAVSTRRITVSTVGITPGLEKLITDRLPCKLAVSLNAPDDELRAKLMPIAKKYPLQRLFPVLHRYEQTTRHRITFEYVLLRGINDDEDSAKKLQRTLSGFTAKLNLIEYNPIEFAAGTDFAGNFQIPLPGTAEKFALLLERPGLTVIIRRSLGGEISAACGQLCIRNCEL